MSHPVEEFELSALIDGELDPRRTAEIRSALEQDPVLRGQYEHLAEVDRAWKSSAESARFVPASLGNTKVTSPSRVHLVIVATLAIMLTAGRLAWKILPIDLTAGIMLQAAVLGAALAVVVWIGDRATAHSDHLGA